MNRQDLAQAQWRKPTRSNGAGNCVEVAQLPGVTAIRDSKLGASSPVLTLTPARFAAFTEEIKRDRLR